jgi:hypothetical protein
MDSMMFESACSPEYGRASMPTTLDKFNARWSDFV